MLVLTRKEGEAVRIGSDVRVSIVQMQGGQVRIAIEAPPEIGILREEVWERIACANREAAEAAIAVRASAAIEGVSSAAPREAGAAEEIG